MKILYCLFIFYWIGFRSIAQPIELIEVKVIDTLKKISTTGTRLNYKQIQALQVEDLGFLLQKLAGVQLKSYGGFGGMKTISVRSLGAQHTAIVRDGFVLKNTQTGLVNLGNISTDEIESIDLISGSASRTLVPSSALIAGNIVYFESFSNKFPTENHLIRASSRIGSFGLFDSWLGYKVKLKSLFFSFSGAFRRANGIFKFSIPNGQTVYSGIRNHNSYEQWNGGFTFGWQTKMSGRLLFQYATSNSNQELPSAVILYDTKQTFQRLYNQDDQIQWSFYQDLKKVTLRPFVSYSRLFTKYLDEFYLNNVGVLSQQFINENVDYGINVRYNCTHNFKLFSGFENQFSKLQSNDFIYGSPFRIQVYGLMGFEFNQKWGQTLGHLAYQWIQDKNALLGNKVIHRILPFVEWRSPLFGKKIRKQFSVFYRESFRMPSFNELYYSNIGNYNLKPEKASQTSISYSNILNNSKFDLQYKFNSYCNWVTDKIVAIPTKNLFVWSMQNIGKSLVFGIDASIQMEYSFNSKWKIESLFNYTFQRVEDRTDKNSPTYRHQIAYVPQNVFNSDLSIVYKKFGLRFSFYGNSSRYALNENVQSNRLDAYSLLDIAVFQSFKFKLNKFKLFFSCKNIINSNYVVVRNYVMPGRNFLISLNYAPH